MFFKVLKMNKGFYKSPNKYVNKINNLISLRVNEVDYDKFSKKEKAKLVINNTLKTGYAMAEFDITIHDKF